MATRKDTAFRRWFGASKVVDRRGEPLKVYHDTAAKFIVFRTRGTGSNTGNTGAYGEGAYFYALAKDSPPPLADRRRVHAYLALQRPFELDDDRGHDLVRRILALEGVTREEARRGLALLKRPRVMTGDCAIEDMFYRPTGIGVLMQGRRLRHLLEANGFDGVITRNTDYPESDELVAFHPEQIHTYRVEPAVEPPVDAAFQPWLDKQGMERWEVNAGGNDIGTKRRIALAVLTTTAQQLRDAARSDAPTFSAIRDAVAAFADHASLLRDVATDALCRLSAISETSRPS